MVQEDSFPSPSPFDPVRLIWEPTGMEEDSFPSPALFDARFSSWFSLIWNRLALPRSSAIPCVE